MEYYIAVKIMANGLHVTTEPDRSDWSMSVPSQVLNIFSITLPISMVEAVTLKLARTLLGHQPKVYRNV